MIRPEGVDCPVIVAVFRNRVPERNYNLDETWRYSIKKTMGRIVLFLTISLILAACAEKEPPTPAEELEQAARELDKAAEDLQQGGAEGLAALGKALESVGRAMNEGARVEPVDFRALQDLLPGRADGLERVDFQGQRGGMGPIRTSEAKATYEGSGRRIELRVVDPGSLTGIAAFGYAWLNREIDQESSSGYERTMKFKGYPAYQKFTRGSGDTVGDAEMSIIVGQRFIVTANGANVSMADLEDAIEDVDLRDLEKMRNEGVQE